MPGTCGDCVKNIFRRSDGCFALVERIGERKNCFAYSNNPDFIENVALEVKEYARRKKQNEI